MPWRSIAASCKRTTGLHPSDTRPGAPLGVVRRSASPGYPPAMRYLHSMVRVRDLDAALRFFVDALGLVEVRRHDHPEGRFTLVFLAAPGQAGVAEVELTYNWDAEDYGSAR